MISLTPNEKMVVDNCRNVMIDMFNGKAKREDCFKVALIEGIRICARYQYQERPAPPEEIRLFLKTEKSSQLDKLSRDKEFAKRYYDYLDLVERVKNENTRNKEFLNWMKKYSSDERITKVLITYPNSEDIYEYKGVEQPNWQDHDER